MAKQELLIRLNNNYEELSVINREIEFQLKQQNPDIDKMNSLLNKKDRILTECLRIKELIEMDNKDLSLNEDPENPLKKEREYGLKVLDDALKQEALNQELVKKSLIRIKEELKMLQQNKGKMKYYKGSANKYGKLDKKG